MIHRFVYHNDRLLPVEEVRLSPGQAGLLSGWGLFTTMRVIEGIPFAFERHWQRLARDAERTHCPFPFDGETVRKQLGRSAARESSARGERPRLRDLNRTGFWRSDEKFPEVDLLLIRRDCRRIASRAPWLARTR